ncbi:SMI1/KNR4 family protein [Bacillus atrophaeus]|uniref:SMI1/KNR4 family protein n=1 Tax=Bacillus atrophaeus TaxID=1452 RepID=UPI000778F551|nr:SMI1/KNR4 family protein [Bacillus atrophaeus]
MDFGEQPVSNEEIIEVENTLQVKFPKDYLDYVKNYSGAIPSPETFDLGDRAGIAFGYLHSFHKESESYIVNVSNRYRDGRIPDKVIPIADDVLASILEKDLVVLLLYFGIMKSHMKILMEL